jgi:hypothetical protein
VRAGWTLLVVWVVIAVGATLYADGWPTDNRVDKWVGQIAEDPGYRILQDRFGGDEYALVRINGFDRERDAAWLGGLGARLSALGAVRQVIDPLSLPGRALAAVLDLADGDRLDFLLLIRVEATPGERAAMAMALRTLEAEAREIGIRVRSAGHPLVAAALDEEAARVERVFAPLLVLIAAIGTALFLRSIFFALCAVLPAIAASSGSRAALRLLGVESDLILVACGPLAFVLLLASSLHFVTAFQRHLGASRRDAAWAAFREKLPAGLLAAVTTAFGFGVFLVSGVRSVAVLGTTIAVTMLVGVPAMFWGLRPVFADVPFGRARARGESSVRWRRLAAWALRRRMVVAPAAVVVLGLSVFAATKLRSETNALHYFPAGHRVRQDFLSIEADGGALSSVEVLVRGSEPGDLGARLEKVDGNRGVFGPEAVPMAVRRAAGRMDASGEWMRWTLRFPTRGVGATRTFVERVREVAGDEAWVAGSMPLMLEMQGRLVETLLASLGLTLAATTLLFFLVFRTLRELSAAAFVNLLPVSAVLLAAWVLAIPLDGATVMVAAAVLGLAVDNTFHLMYAAGTAQPVRMRAALRAFERVGRAAAISSAALALGFLILALSGFAPTARFGLLCAVGAASALLADLVVLPARWIRSRT